MDLGSRGAQGSLHSGRSVIVVDDIKDWVPATSICQYVPIDPADAVEWLREHSSLPESQIVYVGEVAYIPETRLRTIAYSSEVAQRSSRNIEAAQAQKSSGRWAHPEGWWMDLDAPEVVLRDTFAAVSGWGGPISKKPGFMTRYEWEWVEIPPGLDQTERITHRTGRESTRAKAEEEIHSQIAELALRSIPTILRGIQNLHQTGRITPATLVPGVRLFEIGAVEDELVSSLRPATQGVGLQLGNYVIPVARFWWWETAEQFIVALNLAIGQNEAAHEILQQRALLEYVKQMTRGR